MHIVVKGTRTVQEFKEKQKMMNDLAVSRAAKLKSRTGDDNTQA